MISAGPVYFQYFVPLALLYKATNQPFGGLSAAQIYLNIGGHDSYFPSFTSFM